MITIFVRQEDSLMMSDDEHAPIIKFLDKYLNDRADLLESIAREGIHKENRRKDIINRLPDDVLDYLEEAVSKKDRRSKPIPMGYETIPPINVYKKPKRQRKSNGKNSKCTQTSETSE